MTTHRARKRFGQNFLHDAGIINRIIASMDIRPDDHFVEIGPGQGALTRPLAERAARLDVIEIDRDLAAALREADWFAGVTLHECDALSFDFNGLATQPRSLRLAGNLPYNISTPLLFHILDQSDCFRDIHVMLQKEVVQRMTAKPGSKQYGRLTVALAARCRVESLFIIRPGAFRPAPKVDSAIARLTPLDEPLIRAGEADAFDRIVRAAFGQRRKQLGNALRSELSERQIAAAGVDPSLRAEALDVHAYVALARQAGE